MPAWHPFKIFGVASGLALLVGGWMLISRRTTGKDQVGADGYPDRLFLYMVFLVALTGMLSWLVRLTGWAFGAYTVYFVHIVLVFFLLWYMPYSKFAHMFYRGLAIVYCRHVNRSRQRQADALAPHPAAVAVPAG
jgi:quinone-modifying oxidoreductase subunit QmoC